MAIPNFPELERRILQEWKDQDVFGQTLKKPAPRGNFVFFEGPPFANGIPHIGHVEARAFKDLILRYKTMAGFHVDRKAGWDTQGLPVELEVERTIGVSGKKDIEKYGVAKFNAAARESVWKYKKEWETMTERMAYWLDLDHPYITYSNDYIETLWWIFKQAWDQKLLEQDFKVVPYCPRCGTALSSHEVAQGYETVTEQSVYVKFELVDEPGTFVLAWTTTPWTLPGNVALAVGEDIEYVKTSPNESGESFIIAKEKMDTVLMSGDIAHDVIAGKKVTPFGRIKGSDLVGKKYKPLFNFIDLRAAAQLSDHPAPKQVRGTPPHQRRGGDSAAYTIVPADFVTTEDGTGVVHTAVMYGEDDFQLGKKLDLPTVHTVDEQGKFYELVKPWAGKEVRDAKGETQKEIIEWLDKHGKLYKVEDYTHEYPFCWRCKSPLLYYAKTSWFIRMSRLRDQLLANNEKINWYPNYIKDGRFGEWLREVKDWAISRERYWGTPLPIWVCNECKHQECIGSYAELAAKSPVRNRYIFIRHAESTNNVTNTLDTELSDGTAGLTEKGRKQAVKAGKELKDQKISAIYCSQFARAGETAAIIGEELGLKPIGEARVNEYHIGPAYENKTISQFHDGYGDRAERLHEAPPGGETWIHIRKRMFEFLHELDTKYEGQTFLIVTHSDPIYVARWALSLQSENVLHNPPLVNNATPIELRFPAVLFKTDGSFDPHRPFVDEITYPCSKCSDRPRRDPSLSRRGGMMVRTPEVGDTWFDSGSMPYAQWHYPFENKDKIDKGEAFPADYISEAIDQTRGWFYTMLAVGTILKQAGVVKEPPYKNVLVLGLLHDAEGRKLSKSLRNYGSLEELFDKYGADALRWFMFQVNQPWDSKNFDPKTVEEGIRKTFLIAMNVVSFWEMYNKNVDDQAKAAHTMDRWIEARTQATVNDVTTRLEKYDVTGAARSLGDFVTDLSTWYIRRSRDRFKNGDLAAPAVLKRTLITLAKLMAPFTPFIAEEIYHRAGGSMTSVHLDKWPGAADVDQGLLDEMVKVRGVVEVVHGLRAAAGIKVRQPLEQLVVTDEFPTAMMEILREELNIKNVRRAEKLPQGDDWRTTDEVALDIAISDQLREEGLVRDLVRELNALRKAAGLKPEDLIIIHCPAQTLAAKLIDVYGVTILRDARAKAATPSLDGATDQAEIKLGGEVATIGLSRA